jgi:uncharacterized protein (TIGR02757 family)
MLNKTKLDELYTTYNEQRYASPDPLEVVYTFNDPRDQEVVAFIAAMLAYGRVASILSSIHKVLAVLGPQPADCIQRSRVSTLQKRLVGFKHRWTGEEDMVALLVGLRGVLNRYGSLEACFTASIRPEDETIIPAMTRWTSALGREKSGNMISNPEGGSACKKLHMFMRWMVRNDNVDLGTWTQVSPAQLFVPLDTHMFSLCTAMGLTARKQADGRAMQEITQGFAKISPEDPVKYDFCLTRLGIRKGASKEEFLRELGVLKGKR